ncbi:hypothetical protein [Neorhodopirellula lusitana]|uniref:hypothetical protein n=1 Tax=Neorhodopirellula lusitana TaxID=445327 RepID=UPI00384B5A22
MAEQLREEEFKTINRYQDEVTVTPLADWITNGNPGVPQADRKIQPDELIFPQGLPDCAVGQVDKQTAEPYFTLLSAIRNDPTVT